VTISLASLYQVDVGTCDPLDELLLVTSESLSRRSGEDLGSPDSLVLEGRQASGEDGLTDQGDGGTHVEGVDGGPFTVRQRADECQLKFLVLRYLHPLVLTQFPFDRQSRGPSRRWGHRRRRSSSRSGR
jgi:hypothetical protein